MARLRRASELVGEAAAKAAGVPGGEACALAMNTAANSIREAEAVAEKHNATVYIERVPPFSSLPTIEPKAIVRPTLPSELAPPAPRLAEMWPRCGRDVAET